MPDTPEIKQEKETTVAVGANTLATIKTNEKLDKLDETIKKQMSGVVDAVNKPPKKDVEGIKEGKAASKKVLDTLQGILKATRDVVGKAGGGLFVGIKKMFMKYRGIIVKMLGLGLIAMFALLDMKKLKELWIAFKEAITEMAKVLKPIILGIAAWAKNTGLPATFKAIKEQLNLFKEMWINIGKHLEGWGEKTTGEKFQAVMDSFTEVGVLMGKTAENIINWGGELFGVTGLGTNMKDLFKKWFGGKDEGEGGSNFMSKVGGVLAALVGMFAIGKILPGWLGGKLLTAPLKIAIKLLSSSVGGAISGIKGISGMMGPGIVGAATTFGILWLATAIGNGIKEAYLAYKDGDTYKEIWEKGLSGFFRVFYLGLLDKSVTDAFARDTVSMFTDFRDAMFPDEAKKRKIKAQNEKTERGRLAYAKSREGTSVEKQMAEMTREELQDMAAWSGAKFGFYSKTYKQAEKGLRDRIKVIKEEWKKNPHNPANAEEFDFTKGPALPWSNKYQTEQDEAAAVAAARGQWQGPLQIPQIGPKKTPVITPIPGLDKLLTIAISGTGRKGYDKLSDEAKIKVEKLRKLLGGLRITSGWRKQEIGDEAMYRSKDSLVSKYDSKWMATLDDEEYTARPGTEARKRGIKKMRLAGFVSQHEHGNAIDFSWPSAFIGKDGVGDFPLLKAAVLDAFPGAKLIKESDHLHMSFDRKISGTKLAALQGEQGKLQNQRGASHIGGSTTNNNQIVNQSAGFSVKGVSPRNEKKNHVEDTP